MTQPTVNDVEQFWDENPLFTGEESTGDDFFAKHSETNFTDVFFGIRPPEWFAFPANKAARILDLGCGIGFWCEYFAKSGYTDVTGADLSNRSLELARKRLNGHPAVRFQKENAEQLSFANESFDHVNCQGVVHHTPNTLQAIREIGRVTKAGGTASISVYYTNWLVRLYPALRGAISAMFRLFGSNTGRGRDFSAPHDRDELVRLYDGMGNPIGKSYSQAQFVAMCKEAGFTTIHIRYYFFPFRFLSLRFPRPIKQLLLKLFPFMIVANCAK